MDKTFAGSSTKPRFTPPILPQANDGRIVEGHGRTPGDDANHIIVQIERIINRFIDGDTITVCFGGRMRQHIVDTRTDPSPHIPYTFRFAADDLPDGRYSVYYRVQERSYFGGFSSTSPSVSVFVANCSGRNDMQLGKIDLRRTP